ncbi:hypothetical protein GCM10010123_08030 [Pilimelia anulata]|uniref:Esterase n=1 Tax=Pilimelia anulata TaxID=53371 RepID=A0A8J3F7P6_9ACTN|nr:alpha/beta fold hydrolase [Pilimelia anulata]GGJ80484.1 hypothetical protein GCM10010123_08030 [Pilimelia anulata]
MTVEETPAAAPPAAAGGAPRPRPPADRVARNVTDRGFAGPPLDDRIPASDGPHRDGPHRDSTDRDGVDRVAAGAPHADRRATLRRRIVLCAVFALGAALGGAAVAGYSGLADRLSLLVPALCWIVEGLALAALATSWLRAGRRWRRWILPGLFAGAALLVYVTKFLLWHTGAVTDPYPELFLLLAAALLLALAGLPFTLRGHRRAARIAAILAVPLTALGAGLCVNREYGLYVSVGDLLGHGTPLTGVDRLPTGPTAELPERPRRHRGTMVAFTAPGERSGFVARPGAAYLPPAYFTRERDRLPVLLMLPGTPGAPLHFVRSGRAAELADRYAAAHGGRGAVLIFVDPNGRSTHDTECVDGPQGTSETYLTRDVPAAVARTLHVPHDPRRWGVVGFSAGGTCAVHLALRHPDRFGHFVSIGGDPEPALRTPEQTLRELFGGSVQKQRAYRPARILATHRFVGMTGWYAAGNADPHRRTTARALAAASTAAGIRARTVIADGGHTWRFVKTALEHLLPTLYADLGVGAPPGAPVPPLPRAIPLGPNAGRPRPAPTAPPAPGGSPRPTARPDPTAVRAAPPGLPAEADRRTRTR